MVIPPHLNYTLFSRDKCFNFSKNKEVMLHRREFGQMSNQDPNKRFLFEFDEKGTNEVSAQIMDSYNSGYIDQETGQIRSEIFQNNEE
jgi:hypothetical protein